MTDHEDLQKQVIQNTQDIGDMKADIAVVRTNTDWIKEQFGDMKRSFESAVDRITEREAIAANKLEARERNTWDKLADVGIIKLIVFGAVGMILSGFMTAVILFFFRASINI